MTIHFVCRASNLFSGVVVLGNGLTQMCVNSYLRDVFIGVAILAAVGASALARRGKTPSQD